MNSRTVCAMRYVTPLRVGGSLPPIVEADDDGTGVLLSCPQRDFLEARIELDRVRLQAFASGIDVDLIAAHLQTMPTICAGEKAVGPIGQMAQRARFYWLTAPRSTLIQCSSVHSGLCENPQIMLGKIVRKIVSAPLENCVDFS